MPVVPVVLSRWFLGHPAEAFGGSLSLCGGPPRPSNIPASPAPIVYLYPGIFFFFFFFCTLTEHLFLLS